MHQQLDLGKSIQWILPIPKLVIWVAIGFQENLVNNKLAAFYERLWSYIGLLELLSDAYLDKCNQFISFQAAAVLSLFLMICFIADFAYL
jgi:hypothetical protein